jgi:recombinational DNA repair protein RecR
MPDFAEPLARLINEFKRLPGIGRSRRSGWRFTSCARRAKTPNSLRKRCST